MSAYLTKKKFLQDEIDRLQDEKLEALRKSKESKGIEKAEWMDKFLSLNKSQEEFEAELAKIENW